MEDLITKLSHQKEELLKQGVKFPLYFDYQATTQMDKRVLEVMLPFFMENFGNPHSRSHSYGWEAETAVEKARAEIADLIGAEPKEIIFTSGATESNNLAIKGLARFHKEKNHIITVATEHKCVLDTCRHLKEEGWDITYLPVNSNGIIDLELLEKSITDKTILVSVMAINNEIGVIQPLKSIGQICRKHNVFFHSDIAQGYGKIPIDVNDLQLDLASISGHKIYGPKGIGALYVRKKNPRVRLVSLINGGGQERGIRSGTLSPALVAGLGKAALIAKEEMQEEYKRIKYLSDKLCNTILKDIPDTFLNGDKEQRYPGNINISFAYVEGESMILALRDVAISSGSACTSSSLEPSYVLRSIGVSEDLAHTSLRFGIGRFTTEEQVDFLIDLIKTKVDKLRDMSPLWEMTQAGIDISKIKWTNH